jgi:hypothetical protein
MPERPTFASVTDASCRCGYLRRESDDPRQAIVFHRPTREYYFRYRDGDHNGYLTIYHCPFCGGAAPKSKRASLFHVISSDEERRLTALLDGITSIRTAIRKLGKPDDDNPRGMAEQVLERGARRPPTVQWFRTLRYEKLSKIADVWITERADGRASWHLQGKAK